MNREIFFKFWRDFDTPEKFTLNIQKYSLEDKTAMALSALNGDCFALKTGISFQHWLQWVQGHSAELLSFWHWLSLKENSHEFEVDNSVKIDIRNRDAYILALWNSMLNGPNREAKALIESKKAHWAYYENHFFNWFLSRYNIMAARQVYRDTFLAKYCHLIPSILILTITTLFFCNTPSSLDYWSCFALALLVSFLLGRIFSGLQNGNLFIQSLIPRMFVTTLIGTLTLLSAKDLLDVVFSSPLGATGRGLTALTIIAATALYVYSIVKHKTRPQLQTQAALARTFHVMTIALAYAAVNTFLAGPALYSQVYAIKKINSPDQLSAWALLASLILAIGVVLQLVWEDKPVTEPL